MPDREQTKKFINLLKKLNEQQQAGVKLMTEGAVLLSGKKEKQLNRRSHSAPL